MDHGMPIMDWIGEQLGDLEEAVSAGSGPTVHRRIPRPKRGLSALRRVLGPQRDTVLTLTRDEFQPVPPEVRP
jgi:Mg2+ and Co2+ transporter CorA